MSDNSIRIEIDSGQFNKFVESLEQVVNESQVRKEIGKALSHALQESTEWAFKHESGSNTSARRKARSERCEAHVRKPAAVRAGVGSGRGGRGA